MAVRTSLQSLPLGGPFSDRLYGDKAKRSRMAMSEWSDSRLRLAEYLTGLRAELSKVHAEADLDDLKFDFDAATLEVDIAYSLSRSGQPDFWVHAQAQREAVGEPEANHRDRQRLTVRLTLRPEVESVGETPESVSAALPWPTSPKDQQ
ncbi:MAG: hypothetical protein EOS10_21060 [Mesorhizobium sp.]|uniref:trypco2 family protein n=2 Tax=Mesorhizobium sp. TaxID=1871066 RepID=UPI000FEA6D5E|nr:trypco2 family protein [Mesorhizobium sp.]RWO29863.1 MAG: hypothetical protein EOS10_21060 [Mesorhizobium sp.]